MLAFKCKIREHTSPPVLRMAQRLQRLQAGEFFTRLLRSFPLLYAPAYADRKAFVECFCGRVESTRQILCTSLKPEVLRGKHLPFLHADQGNAESVPVKLEVLGTMEVSYKHFEALLVFTVSPKRVEACGTVAECLLFSLTILGRINNACAYNKHQLFQWYKARNFREAPRCASTN